MAASRDLAEWRSWWRLPLVAALGAATSTLSILTLGAFLAPLETAFGWTRLQTLSGPGVTRLGIIGAVGTILVGALIDRRGARRVGIIGVALGAASFALLGAITGSLIDWQLHWLVIALAGLLIPVTVWAIPIASRFDRSRGLALAVSMSGVVVSAFAFPLISHGLTMRFGFRGGFIGIAAIWLAVVLPLLLAHFRSADDAVPRRADGTRGRPPGLTLRQAIRTGAFYQLLAASLISSLIFSGLMIHLGFILVAFGWPPESATTAAGVVGLVAFFAKLATGAILDRLRPNWVGGASFVPVAFAFALLLLPVGHGGQLVAVGLIGAALGSELLAILYLATRHFGLRSFGVLFGAVIVAGTIGAALSPLLIATIFERTYSYARFIQLGILLALLGAALLLTLGAPPVWETEEETGERGPPPGEAI